jgi:hypothetical protein
MKKATYTIWASFNWPPQAVHVIGKEDFSTGFARPNQGQALLGRILMTTLRSSKIEELDQI